MIFVTSGSMLPFDRLFKLVDSAVAAGILSDVVFAQIGEGKYLPQNYQYERFVEKGRFDDLVKDASLVIAHAGIGVIMQCLAARTPLLVLPRRAKLGEHVNDHQVSTALKFEQLGHILAFEESNLPEKLEELKTFVPKERRPNTEGVSQRVASFLRSL